MDKESAKASKRRHNVATIVDAARKAGARTVTFLPDGTVLLDFAERAADHVDDETNPWDAVLTNAAHQKRLT
jgi:hypothetical protein